MGIDIDRLIGPVNAAWDSYPVVIVLVAVAAAVAVLGLLAGLVVRLVRRLARIPDAKLHIGFAVVQAGVTVAVLTGVYEFFGHVLGLPLLEAAIIAGFIEATVWVAVGLIRRHARLNPGAGLGRAGGFFWLASIGGGGLAVLGSATLAAASGRVIIVALGTAMWWLRIREWVPATGARSRWRWTPRRLLLALGAITPADDDIEDQSREWQVRRLARALARANAGRPWRWLGERAIGRRALDTPEDVIDEAYRRYAAAWLARSEARIGSQRMLAAVAAVRSAPETAPEPGAETGGSVPVGTAGSGGQELRRPPRTSSARTRLRKAAARTSGQRRGAGADQGSLADVIRSLQEQHPELTRAELAARAGSSDRYVRMVLGPASAPGSAPEVNGRRPELVSPELPVAERRPA